MTLIEVILILRAIRYCTLNNYGGFYDKIFEREFIYWHPTSVKRALDYCQYEINRYIGGVRNVIRHEWRGFDNVVEYKLDNLVQP